MIPAAPFTFSNNQSLLHGVASGQATIFRNEHQYRSSHFNHALLTSSSFLAARSPLACSPISAITTTFGFELDK
jgi:hypothetical protein